MKLPRKKGGLEFCDLYSFSLALLARQAWRLINVRNPCVHGYYKLGVFSDGKILSAEPEDGISYTWRRILKEWSLSRRNTYGM